MVKLCKILEKLPKYTALCINAYLNVGLMVIDSN